jgi:hypothetical protein
VMEPVSSETGVVNFPGALLGSVHCGGGLPTCPSVPCESGSRVREAVSRSGGWTAVAWCPGTPAFWPFGPALHHRRGRAVEEGAAAPTPMARRRLVARYPESRWEGMSGTRQCSRLTLAEPGTQPAQGRRGCVRAFTARGQGRHAR